jgi:hypothetical protein
MKSRRWLSPVRVLAASLLLAACASQAEDLTQYAPAPLEASLETWAVRYPLQYDEWEGSAHGQAFLAGKAEAPGCTGCHPDPESGAIRTAAFRNEIPGRCGRCHADAVMMAPYGLSADVYDTYLAEYHGQTVAYYRAAAPDTWRFEAVCSDCHGSHATPALDDPQSPVAAANLTATCQKCHHDASFEFASAFGHYRPGHSPVSASDSSVVFWVKLFYQAMIPVVLVGMVGYIGLDVRHRRRHKQNEGKHAAK